MFKTIKDIGGIANMIDEISKEYKEFENKYSKDYNIYEENGYKHYEFMLPGFEKEAIGVELNHNNEIIVTTSKKKLTRQYTEKNVKSTKMFKVQLPSELINESIKTDFNNGVFTLSFKAQNNPKLIKID